MSDGDERDGAGVNTDLRDVTLPGVLLVLATVAAIALVAWPVGALVLARVDRETFRGARFLVVAAAAVPAALAGVVVFLAGRRLLARRGIAWARPRRRPDPDEDVHVESVADLVAREHGATHEERIVTDLRIRPETPADVAAIHVVNTAAFPTRAEADLVDRLRAAGALSVSLVAESGGAIVGHVAFSPVTLDACPAARIAGLAPMAVHPSLQRRGLGTALVRAGLAACRAAGFDASVVLGHPAFYPRFGYVPSARFGFRSGYDVADDVFLAQELVPGALAGASGVARYHREFAAL